MNRVSHWITAVAVLALVACNGTPEVVSAPVPHVASKPATDPSSVATNSNAANSNAANTNANNNTSGHEPINDTNVVTESVVVSDGGTIKGRVMGLGVPLENWLIQVFESGQQTVTNATGHFEIKDVPPGEHLVNVLDGKMYATGVFSLRILTVPVRPNEVVHLDVEFGNGQPISGTVLGLAAEEAAMILIRRPGGPAPEDVDPFDRDMQIEASKFIAAYGGVKAGETGFQMVDVEPGTYFLEVMSVTPVDPNNPTHRLILHREEITVDKTPLTFDIQL
ncbi:MAG: hypothetical protein AAF581_20460 [Planctomycetota bacterium]